MPDSTLTARRSRAFSLVSDDLSNAESELAELVSERAVVATELGFETEPTTAELLDRVRYFRAAERALSRMAGADRCAH